MHRSEPLRSRGGLVTGTTHRHFMPVNAGCTPGSRALPKSAPLGRRGNWTAREHGVQPALTGPARRCVVPVTSPTRERSGSLQAINARRATRALQPIRVRIALSASSLVTFFWRRRRKLLARRGEFPARCTESNGSLQKHAKARTQTHPIAPPPPNCAAECATPAVASHPPSTALRSAGTAPAASSGRRSRRGSNRPWSSS